MIVVEEFVEARNNTSNLVEHADEGTRKRHCSRGREGTVKYQHSIVFISLHGRGKRLRDV
jgi:hypothetical protein